MSEYDAERHILHQYRMFRSSDKASVFIAALTQLAIHLCTIFLRVRNLLIIDVDHNKRCFVNSS